MKNPEFGEKRERVLLAGATGYPGGYIAKELQSRSGFFRIVARNLEKIVPNHIEAGEVLISELTDPFFYRNRGYGPIEFFMTVMAMEMRAPEYGTHTLREYFTDVSTAQAWLLTDENIYRTL